MRRITPFAVGFTVLLAIFPALQAYGHFFGETKQVDEYQIVFAPFPLVPEANNNSTYLNFSVLENGTNIFNIHAAVVISDKDSGEIVGQVPYRLYEYSDISIPFTFSSPGDYLVTLQARITGDEKYQATPLEASFDLSVENRDALGNNFQELMLFFVTPAAVAIAGIAIYLHSKGKI